MNIIQLILFALVIDISMELIIEKTIPFCKATSKSIDLDINCQDFNCLLYKNTINILAKFDDEYNFVHTTNNQKIVIYTLNGIAYYTECQILS